MLRTALMPSALLLSSLLIGCTPAPAGDDDDSAVANDDDSAPTEGTLAVSFAIDEDWYDRVVNNGDPVVGPFWATIFDADDVTGVGPEDGAREYGDVYVEEVDLSVRGEATGVLFITKPLPATWVTILGFMDVDGNSVEDDRDPDEGDPVTLPNRNEFEVLAGEEAPAEVFFNFLNP